MRTLRVGLVGDYSSEVTAHRAIPLSLRIASGVLGCAIEETWLPTEALATGAAIDLDGFDGLWCAPASPYRSYDGAVRAIRHAREHRTPFLGTCGGFQHAVLEYAQNVLGHEQAEHAELNPVTAVPLMAPLACSLVEADGKIVVVPGTRLAGIYGCPSVVERYRCRYGMNPAYLSWFARSAMRVCAVDEAGEPRAIELEGHPFFFGTAYQPERWSLTGQPHPLIVAFAHALTTANHGGIRLQADRAGECGPPRRGGGS